jgi:peroxiredoxin
MLMAILVKGWLDTPVSPGNQAPHFSAITLNGDTLNLDSLHGNIVLIDFWASWNVPSRRNNLTTKKLYEKYRAASLRKKRKFMVIQISLDTRQDLLQSAISKDNLYWKTHVCDFLGWKSPYVSLFNLRRIPTNFLIDTSGTIVAKDVWEGELDNQLNRLMQ